MPEINHEEMILTQLNVMSILYGRESVERAVDMALEYSEAHGGDYDVSITMQFIAVLPKGSDDPESTVFAVHVPSNSIFIDEAGQFGPAKTAKEARDEWLAAKSEPTEEESPPPQREPKNVITLGKNRRTKTVH